MHQEININAYTIKIVKKLSWFPGLNVEYTHVYPSLASEDATRSARSAEHASGLEAALVSGSTGGLEERAAALEEASNALAKDVEDYQGQLAEEHADEDGQEEGLHQEANDKDPNKPAADATSQPKEEHAAASNKDPW